MKLISLIFSFKNEEKNIQELIDRVSKTLSQLKDRWNYEMIFVNDASTDKSEQILIELQSKYEAEPTNLVTKLLAEVMKVKAIQFIAEAIAEANYS